MLSILIPIYNFNVSKLVYSLHKQATEENIVFEILLFDDFSSIYKEENKKLGDLNSVSYKELPENIGRSKIRNLLVTKAKYQNLIFLDCDSYITNSNFIKNYLENSNYQVICGGTLYDKTKPQKRELYLHWLYGSKRESLTTKQRQKNSNRNFKTNNFFIKKNIFDTIKFNEKISKYGHEDTFFGFELESNNIKIHHIENPVIHIGLEQTDIFLQKITYSIQNLLELYNSKQYTLEFFKRIKLFNYFFILKKYYLCVLIKLINKIFNKLIINNLSNSNAKLILLDLLKLNVICSIK